MCCDAIVFGETIISKCVKEYLADSIGKLEDLNVFAEARERLQKERKMQEVDGTRWGRGGGGEGAGAPPVR